MTREEDLKKDGKRLVESFFALENAALLDELRVKTEAYERKKMLREVVKIQDEPFLKRLDALGVGPETALAVTLIPLVFVAWADGKLDDREREAVLQAASERGATADRIGRQLLRDALARQPDPRLFAVWKTYVGRLWGCFTADERWQMRGNVLRAAREVAEAAGGILGLTSRISAEERRVLEDFEKLLD
jgi:tellurite resistance protein